MKLLKILNYLYQGLKANLKKKCFPVYCNIIKVWEAFHEANIKIDIGSDQTSLLTLAGGYYPINFFDEANEMMASKPDLFKKLVQDSLIKHVEAINEHTKSGTYFFDYGNAFLLEASRAGANVFKTESNEFKYLVMFKISWDLCFLILALAL